MPPFRLGIVGFGRLARQYYTPALRGLAGMDRLLVADPLEASRDAARRAFPRAMVFTDPGDLLEQRPDGLIVATPPSSHLSLWRAAMRAGVPVLMEKPFVLGGELPAATGSEEAQRLLMIDFNRRFWGPYRRVGELVRGGVVGDVVRAELVLRVDVVPWNAVTRHRLDPVEGGALFDLGSQMVDLATWLLGREPWAVMAVAEDGSRPDGEVRIDLMFPGEVVARCMVGYGGRTAERISIECTRGWIRMADPNKGVHVERGGGGRMAARAALSDYALLGWRGVFRSRSMSRRSIALAIRAFVDGIRRSAPFSPGFADAARSTRLLEAAVLSMQLGRPVDPTSAGEELTHGRA